MINAAIIGASGYSGTEVFRLLCLHGAVTVTRVIAHSMAGRRVDEVVPSLLGLTDHEFEQLDPDSLRDADVVFVALPSGEAMNVVPQIIGKVGRVIDLGGDFRLQEVALYETFYGHKHHAAHLLQEVVYGLPELNKQSIREARFVANPGCYPTSAILPLLPALQNKLVASDNIIINSLSGTSGAGRSASVELSFTEVNENIRAYKVTSHQHIPEIESVLTAATGGSVSVSFVPHLVPLTRGIYTTIQAQLLREVTEDELFAMYRSYYQESPFVRILRGIPQVKHVTYTNFCDMGFAIDRRTGRLVLMSVIDNLLKGAAGQAVQNMNIMFDFSEDKGLLDNNRAHKEKQYVQ